MRSASVPALPAGFRFHPTDEELIVHYLMNQAASMACPVPIIAAVNIYKFNPWDLPAKALFGENEWYFFSPRDRKYPNGARPNRAAGSGYWKATGTDKAILSTPTSDSIGVKKALVFYRGKPPKGVKTDWIMHEYRLTAATAGKSKHRRGSSMRLDDWVLCRIYKKSNDFQHSSSDVQDQEEGSTVEEDSLDVKETSPKSEAPAGDGQLRPMMTITKSCSLTDLLSTMDYAALSQLLLDGSSDAALEPPPSPLIAYATPICQTLNYESNVNNHINYESNVNNHINYESNVNNYINSQVETCSDYSANFNGLKRKRVLTDSAAFVEDGSNFTKKLIPRSDSRISNFGSYCNQQLADQSSFQYSSLLSCPFPLNQQLLLNNHLQMQ